MKKHGALRTVSRLAEAALAWGFYFLLKLLPVEVASAAVGKLARWLGPFIPVSHVARVNLAIAFPHKIKAEKEKILRGCWENLGRVVGEFPHLRQIAQEDNRVTIIGGHYVHEIKRSGKSAILFSGHLANWEVLAATAALQGIPVSLVYRPASNPWTESLYQYARRGITRAQYPKNRDGAKQILQALKHSDEVMAMLVDQKMNDGVAIPFFGKPAMTAKAIAEFALRYQVPVYPIRIQRNKDVNFTIEILPRLTMPEGSEHAEKVVALLTTINQLLEQWIAQKPEDWFWLHRRWPKEIYK